MTPDNVILVLILNIIQSWPFATVVIAGMTFRFFKWMKTQD